MTIFRGVSILQKVKNQPDVPSLPNIGQRGPTFCLIFGSVPVMFKVPSGKGAIFPKLGL